MSIRNIKYVNSDVKMMSKSFQKLIMMKIQRKAGLKYPVFAVLKKRY